MTATTATTDEPFPTLRRPRQRLLVFARYPELGRVKTRLARELGDEKTLEIYRAMVQDLLQSIGRSSNDIEIEIGWTGGDGVAGQRIREFFDGHSLFVQSGATLGDRLTVAFTERVFFHAADKVIAIGTDDPSLPRHLIETAFSLLDSCEWVIGPAHDGGYYMIGARGGSFRGAVFEDIAWGESTVYDATHQRIKNLNASLAVLPLRRDIDHLDDLLQFTSHPDVTPRVAATARRLEIIR